MSNNYPFSTAKVRGRKSDAQVPRPPWPVLDDEALYGAIGKFVKGVTPYTEADPAALLINALIVAGLLLGDAASISIKLGGSDHRMCLFGGIIGRTAKARKGTSTRAVRPVMERIDAEIEKRVLSGFGSGEALIMALAEQATSGLGVILEEQELASVLKVCAREGSILGQVIRKGWDGDTLQRRVVKGAMSVSGYRFSVIGHATHQEMTNLLTDADVWGGTVNRILWFAAKRGKLQAAGGNPPAMFVTNFAEAITDAMSELSNQAIMTANGRLEAKLSPDALLLWEDMYAVLGADDPPGLLGAVVARAEPQVLRVALIFAAMDETVVISPEHLRAAHAVWRYSRDSAAHIFGISTGDRRNDSIFAAILNADPPGISTLALNDVVGTHNLEQGEMKRRLGELEAAGLVESFAVPTAGRSATLWVPRQQLSSLISHNSQVPPSHTQPGSEDEVANDGESEGESEGGLPGNYGNKGEEDGSDPGVAKPNGGTRKRIIPRRHP